MTHDPNMANLDDHRVHECAFARCPCGREWTVVFPVGTKVLECPGCGIMAPTDEMQAMARYVVDVPAGAFEAFMEFLSTSPGVNYIRLGFEPLRKET